MLCKSVVCGLIAVGLTLVCLVSGCLLFKEHFMLGYIENHAFGFLCILNDDR